MRKNHYVHVLMMAGAALLLWTAPSMAMEGDPGPGPGGPMGEGPGMRQEKALWKEEEKSLGLTDEQREKMKMIREAFKTQQETLRAEMKVKHEALRQELDAEKPDRGKAEAVVREIGALEQKMGLQRVDMILKIREMLTPEQYKKLQAFREKKMAEFKERRGKKKFEGPKE